MTKTEIRGRFFLNADLLRPTPNFYATKKAFQNLGIGCERLALDAKQLMKSTPGEDKNKILWKQLKLVSIQR